MTHGDGRVVLLGMKPQWRGQPFGNFRILFNALYGAGVAVAAPPNPGFREAPEEDEEEEGDEGREGPSAEAGPERSHGTTDTKPSPRSSEYRVREVVAAVSRVRGVQP